MNGSGSPRARSGSSVDGDGSSRAGGGSPVDGNDSSGVSRLAQLVGSLASVVRSWPWAEVLGPGDVRFVYWLRLAGNTLWFRVTGGSLEGSFLFNRQFCGRVLRAGGHIEYVGELRSN